MSQILYRRLVKIHSSLGAAMITAKLTPQAQNLRSRFGPLQVEDVVGFIPQFLSESDPRSAREQFQANYTMGGWNPFKGFRKTSDHTLHYPGDPAMPALAEMKLRDELILVYAHAWVCVVQPDGEWEVARMD